MAETDFDTGGFEDGIDTVDFLNDAAADFKTAQDFFEKNKGEIWKGEASAGELTKDPATGDLHTEVNGKDINLSEMRRLFNDGDYGDFFKQSGVDGDFKAQIDDLQAKHDATTNGEIKILQEQVDAQVTQMNGELGKDFNPKDTDELVEKIRKAYGADVAGKIDDLSKKFDEMKKNLDPDKIKEAANKPAEEQKGILDKAYEFFCGEMGGFKCLLLRLIQLAALAALAYLAKDFVDWLKKIGHVLSGCWSYMGQGDTDPTRSGNCKIFPLTCNTDDLNNSTDTTLFPNVNTFTECKACTTNIADPNCGKNSTTSWIPIVSANFCACPSAGPNYLAGYNSFNIDSPSTDTGANVCQTQTSCGKPAPPAGITSACPNAAGCVAWNEACASSNTQNEDCSSWCDSSKVQTVPGQVIKCQQCNITCALATAVGDIFHIPSSLLGEIEKILLWVALGIVVLVVGYIGLRFVMGMFGSAGSHSKKAPPVQIELVQTAPKVAPTAFSRRKKKY